MSKNQVEQIILSNGILMAKLSSLSPWFFEGQRHLDI